MTLSNTWNRLIYTLYAPFYDLAAAPFERGRERAVGGLALDGSERVLVPACGTGLDLEYFPDGTDVTAIDLVPAMVERADERTETLDLNLETRVGDATTIDAPDDPYDVVCLHLVLSVVPDPEAVLQEAVRVLDPDGRISIYDKFVPTEESASITRRVVDPAAKVLFADRNRSLEPMLERAGLEAGEREAFLGGVYEVTVARPAGAGG